MSGNALPSADDLLSRANKLVPLLKSKAAWSEENRYLSDDVIDALATAGMFDLRRPIRYGGYETSSRTLTEVISTLASGDGSTGWNVAVWTTGGWMAAMFPDHVQDEVLATPGTRICAALSPTAVATNARDGVVVNGRWRFMSGARHSQWQVVITMAPAPDGGQWPVAALVPMADLTIVDDWYTAGLTGTGSVTTVAEDVFVPSERTIPMPAVLQGQYLSELNAASPVFRAPMIPTGSVVVASVGIGLARAARTTFLADLPDRKLTYTDYQEKSHAPTTQLQVVEATFKLEEAEFHVRQIADLLDEKGDNGADWKLEERARSRGWLGRSIQLSKDSVDILSAASGGSSIYRSAPIQRIQRDTHACSMHALAQPSVNFELYGRVLCGLEPNSVYI